MLLTQIALINSKLSENGAYNKVPTSGLNINLAGKNLCLTIDSEGLKFRLDDEKQSPLKRLKYIPRLSAEINYAGKRLTYKSASLIEALKNLDDKKVTLGNVLNVSEKQFNEILLPVTHMEEDTTEEHTPEDQTPEHHASELYVSEEQTTDESDDEEQPTDEPDDEEQPTDEPDDEEQPTDEPDDEEQPTEESDDEEQPTEDQI